MPDGAIAAPRLPPEHLGRVRTLLQRVEVADDNYVAGVLRLLQPIRERRRRMPGRNFRPEQLAALERDWHVELNSPYRISCVATLTRHSLSIEECAISTSTLVDPEWGGDGESGLSVAAARLEIRRGVVQFSGGTRAIFSRHALVRRLQRGPSASDDDLLDDVSLLARHDASADDVGSGFYVHTVDGRWAGRCVRLDRNQPVTLAVRTWLNDHMGAKRW